MPECAKTHLQQSRISKFSGGPPDPLFKWRGGEGRGKGRREGGEEWGLERGGALDMGSAPPPRDKLWIRPLAHQDCVTARLWPSRTRDIRPRYVVPGCWALTEVCALLYVLLVVYCFHFRTF